MAGGTEEGEGERRTGIQDVNVIMDACGSRRAALTHFCSIAKGDLCDWAGFIVSLRAFARLITHRAFVKSNAYYVLNILTRLLSEAIYTDHCGIRLSLTFSQRKNT